MTALAPLALTLTVERLAGSYRLTAKGPLGTGTHDISAAAAAALAEPANSASDGQGARLTDVIITGEVRGCLRAHREAAQREGRILRLVYRARRDKVAGAWPIEALRDPETREALALAGDVTLLRDEPDWPPPRAFAWTLPLKILVVIAEPGDRPEFGGAALFGALQAELRAAVAAGRVQITPTPAATERALVETLSADGWHVLHFIGQGASRPAARHGTLTFEGSGRGARDINAQHFARLCSNSPSLAAVVLQAVARTAPRAAFDVVTHTLLESGIPAVAWLPDFGQSHVSAVCAGELYGHLALGEPIDDAMAAARRALAPRGSNPPLGIAPAGTDPGYWSGPVLYVREAALTTARPEPAALAATPSGSAASAPIPARESALPTEPAAVMRESRREKSAHQIAVERKRNMGEFDVFLCHNVIDKGAVKDLGRKLMDHGILPWLDEWELRPGMPWQQLLEEHMGHIKSVAVFVGREGIGPWQRQELDGFLREFARRQCPVIPVLLPGAPAEPRLPRFLEGMTWVDFRVPDPDPLARLIWGITGLRPDATW